MRKFWKGKLRPRDCGYFATGLGYGGAVCLLSRLLVRNVDSFLPLLELEEKTADHIGQVLAQLHYSAIVSPWLLAAAVCGVLGWLLSRIPNRKGRIGTAVTLALVLLLPMLLGALWFTQINGIMVGKLVLSILQWI